MLFAELARGAYLVLSLVIGARLLRLHFSNRQLPELLMAVCLLSEGFLYNSLRWITLGVDSGSTLGEVLEGISRPMLVISSLAVAAFAWKTLRPAARWAPVLLGLLALPMAAWIVDAVFVDSRLFAPATPARSTLNVAFLLCYLWGAVETGLYYSMAKRQLRVGLDVDPMVASRSFFLSLSFSAFVFFWAVAIAMVSLSQSSELTTARTWLLGITGVVRVVGLWLAFLPPKAFVERVRNRAAAAQGAAA